MSCIKKLAPFAAVLAVSLVAQTATAQQWGNLKGRFVFDDKAPTPKKVDVTKEPYCENCNVVEENLIVGKDGGLANVVVYLRTKPGQKVPVHPDYEATKSQEVVIDNKCCRFEPRVAIVRTGQPLVVTNTDPVAHNTNISTTSGRNPAFNQILPAESGKATYTFKYAETFPAMVACNIHPWMKGYVIVRDDPYAAASGDDGTFEIKNLPVGEYEFQFRHADSKFVTDVTRDGKKETWKSGRTKIKIEPGDNDLGEIKVKL